MNLDVVYTYGSIGVHSVRKGVATYCSSGTAICARVGWSMVGVKNRDIKRANEFRTVPGVDVTPHKFTASPLLSDPSEAEEDDIDDAKATSLAPPRPNLDCYCAYL